ncbi:MAG: CrcB family protein [Planctomycetes bacterium]|jgi:CrcB protein|nr:CrcB family protein [Planctomycetota bacterium]
MQASLLVAIAVAGSLGSLCRYLLTVLVVSWCGTFPLHTFVVNLLGCLLFGVCWAMGHGRWPANVTTVVLVGFFGAFTTFSSLAFDCVMLAEDRRFGALAANLLGQNVLGLLSMWGGIALGNWLSAE